jgi:hypothetical protein
VGEPVVWIYSQQPLYPTTAPHRDLLMVCSVAPWVQAHRLTVVPPQLVLFTTKRTRPAAQRKFLLTNKQASAQLTRLHSSHRAPAGRFFTAGALGAGIVLDEEAEDADGAFVKARPCTK